MAAVWPHVEHSQFHGWPSQRQVTRRTVTVWWIPIQFIRILITSLFLFLIFSSRRIKFVKSGWSPGNPVMAHPIVLGEPRASFSTTTTTPCGSPWGFIPTTVPCDGVLTHPQTLNKPEPHHYSSHIGPPSAYDGLIGGHRPLPT
ncbi:hypothetical protein BDM02DRAFT_1369098 [Thelephora ganbajun]|uniref:Uncharacterized protein n=1 Tax=Thelephora ganbajun TaxID=370292 RepID=A0ACB6Z263_THEGA|nr:hypothetical protein BDM02DRAFT_1369098 [Thelephora ganbajun]